MVKIGINELENEKQAVISVYKKQLDALQWLKKDIEKAEWADIHYDQLVVSINEIIEKLCDVLQILTNGKDVYVIDELIDLANDYLNCGKKFPMV